MKIGVVGARKHPNIEIVTDFISMLHVDSIIVSGGANGVDIIAATSARKRGMRVIEHLPKDFKVKEEYLARNQLIVDDSDILVAFTEGSAGGTWDTIRKAKSKGIPVYVV